LLILDRLPICWYLLTPVRSQVRPAVDLKFDGHIIVFDTKQDKIIARINIPQVAGMVDALDLRKIYAADAEENIIYSIDVNTLKATPIQLDDNEGPDAISYDPVDHRIFVSDPGAPARSQRKP